MLGVPDAPGAARVAASEVERVFREEYGRPGPPVCTHCDLWRPR
jgi:hypothetical protein